MAEARVNDDSVNQEAAMAGDARERGGTEPPRGARERPAGEFALAVHEGGPSSPAEWDQAVAASRDTWFYHTSKAVNLFGATHHRPPLFLECRRGGQLVGGVILSVVSRPWHGLWTRSEMRSDVGRAWTSPFVAATLDAKESETVFDRLVAESQAIAAASGCEALVLNDSNQSLRCVLDRPVVNRYMVSTEWHHQETYYWLLDLRGDWDVLWNNIARSQRAQIEQAQTKLAVVCGAELPAGRQALIDLVAAVEHRHRLALAGAEELACHWDAIYATDLGQAFFCLDGEKPCTVAGVARWGKVASYVHAGRSSDAMNGAAALCLWSAIRWAKNVGCEWLDLNSMIPHHHRKQVWHVSQFKKRFGGEIIAVRGARTEIARIRRATFEFVDAWGAATKEGLRRLAGRRPKTESSSASDSSVAAVPREESSQGDWRVSRSVGRPTSCEEWDSVVRESRDTWLYHLSDLAPLFQPPKTDPLTFVELRQGDRLVGGAILEVMRYRWHGLYDQKYLRGNIGSQTVSPFLAGRLTAAVASDAWDRLLDACCSVATDYRCLDLLLWDTMQSPRVVEDRPIVSRYGVGSGWSPLATYHYVLDLNLGIDALFKNVQSRRRTYIRRAREQFQVVTGRDFPGGREASVELMYQREGRVVVPSEQLRKIYDAVYDGRHGEAIFCLQDGKPITFTGVSRLRDVASYLHGARIDETQHGAHALGFWAGVEWAATAGCRWFDCNTATFEKKGRERMQGISEFKRGFGGSLMVVHGARHLFHRLERANCEFVDACGVAFKSLFRKIAPPRK
jgi:hypothetical protein